MKDINMAVITLQMIALFCIWKDIPKGAIGAMAGTALILGHYFLLKKMGV